MFSIIESKTELIYIATSQVGAKMRICGFRTLVSLAFAALPVKREEKQTERKASVFPDPLKD